MKGNEPMRTIVCTLLVGVGMLAHAPRAAADPVPFPEAPVPGMATFSNVSTRVRALLVHGDTIYAAGRFSVSQGSATRNNIAAFDFNGNLKPEFSVEPNGAVWALATDGVSLFVGGEFTRLGLKSRLAAVDLVTGAVKRDFTAHIHGVLDVERPTVVRALAVLTDTSTQPATVRLIVGGNFTQVNSAVDNRSGLAALIPSNGALDTARFVQGVSGIAAQEAPDQTNLERLGFVTSLVASAGSVYVGGSFTTIQGRRASLAALNPTGTIQNGSFSSSGYPIMGLTLDPVGSRLFAAVGGVGFGANRVRAYRASGTSRGSGLWQGPRRGGSTRALLGDVQSVHYFGGNVYFGFHDGMFTEPDPYKIGVIDADTGNQEVDLEHQGLVCDSGEEERVNCWLPELDATNGQGFFGVWAIRDFFDPVTNQQALVVGGEFTQIGGVARTRRLAIFRAP